MLVSPKLPKSFKPTHAFEDELTRVRSREASKGFFMSEMDGKLAAITIVNRQGNRFYELTDLRITSHYRVHGLPVRSPYRNEISCLRGRIHSLLGIRPRIVDREYNETLGNALRCHVSLFATKDCYDGEVSPLLSPPWEFSIEIDGPGATLYFVDTLCACARSMTSDASINKREHPSALHFIRPIKRRNKL